METTKEEKAKALEDLRQMFPAGSTVYTICRRVAKSGMGAWYSVLGLTPEGWALPQNYPAAVVSGYRLKDIDGRAALWIGGCGYDRARHLVDNLSYALYRNDRALKHEAL